MTTDQDPEVITLKGNEHPETIELKVEDLSKNIHEIDIDKYVDPRYEVGCTGTIIYFLSFAFSHLISEYVGKSIGGAVSTVILLSIPVFFIVRYREKSNQKDKIKERIFKAQICDHDEYDEDSVCTSCGLSANPDSFILEVGGDTWEIGNKLRIISDNEEELIDLEDVETTSIGTDGKVKLMGDNPRMIPISSRDKLDRISKSLNQMRYKNEDI